MNFDLSEEQLILRDQARKFLSERAAPSRVRRVLETDALYDADLWRGMVEMAWPGTAIPEAFGGALDLRDMGGAVMDPALAPMRAAFQEALLYAPGARIAGGTDEILKNVIAERVLGLPADIRVDKDGAFQDVPTGRP
jgi:alkylation response protein AidB-like acyl-CoA dehydrogenase